MHQRGAADLEFWRHLVLAVVAGCPKKRLPGGYFGGKRP
jgi:hypothetical protein